MMRQTKQLAEACRQAGALAAAVVIRKELFKTSLPSTEIERIIQHGLQNYKSELPASEGGEE